MIKMKMNSFIDYMTAYGIAGIGVLLEHFSREFDYDTLDAFISAVKDVNKVNAFVEKHLSVQTKAAVINGLAAIAIAKNDAEGMDKAEAALKELAEEIE